MPKRGLKPKLQTIRCYAIVEQCESMGPKPWVTSVYTYGPGGNLTTANEAKESAEREVLMTNGRVEMRHAHLTVCLQPINDFKKPRHKLNSLNDLIKNETKTKQ